MTDTYNDTTGSRKKFLIPLVVLLLCAVSLTGAGYAYNSSVTTNNGPAEGATYVVNTYGDAAGTTVKLEPIDGTVPVVVFSSATTYTTAEQGTADIKANGNGLVKLGEIYFKVTSTVAAEAQTTYVTVSSAIDSTGVDDADNLDDDEKTAVKGVATAVAGSLTYKVYNSASALQDPTAPGKYTLTTGATYKVEVYAQYTADATVSEDYVVGDGDPNPKVETVVGYFDAAFDLVKYNITIVADSVAPSP